ncbi:hypothetical protein Taro_045514 [Colocasia esculenta]|uniref:Uncharacterized protein n=1 Tax=Colocasia esculenta TaxID=4460 RepID=A0A843X4C0_COLES|nr:hypothetical protein [Colocasia esculenta]
MFVWFWAARDGASHRLFHTRFCHVVLPQGLRYASSVGLAGAFWRVFPERCLGGSSGGSPRTGLCCFCSSAGCSILSDVSCSLVIWVVHSGEGSSQDHPLSLLVEVLPRSALRSLRATVVLPCGSKCVVWLGCVLVRISQDGSWRFWWRFSPRLLRVVLVVVALSPSFSRPRWWDCVSLWLGWFASFLMPCVLS